MHGQMSPFPYLLLHLFCFSCAQRPAVLTHPLHVLPHRKEKRQTPTNYTSLQPDPPSPPLTPQTTLGPILLLAASRPGLLGQHCFCLPRQCSLQRQKKGQMAGPLGWDPTSCVLVFQDKLSGVASVQSPSFFSPNPISEPEEGALPASRRSLLPRESQA